MAEDRIVIDIQTVLQGLSNSAVPGAKPVISSEIKPSSKFGGFTGGLSAGFFLEGGKKLLSAFGQSEAVQAIEKGSRYSFLAVRAVSGDPSAMISLITNISAEVITAVREMEMEKAARANDYDIARMRSGLMRLDADVVVGKDSWGRMTYKSKRG